MTPGLSMALLTSLVTLYVSTLVFTLSYVHCRTTKMMMMRAMISSQQVLGELLLLH